MLLLPVDLRFYSKYPTMNRISYLILFLLIGFTAKSQVLTVTTESNEACINESIWLKASGHNLYVWSDTVRLDTYLSDSVNFSAPTAGTYSITVLGYTIFPADTDTVAFNITVNPNPTVTINSSANAANNFICIGDTATLQALGNGLSAFAWSPAISTTDSAGQSTGVYPALTTSYVVTVTDTNGCSNTGTKQVKVNLNPPSVAIDVSTSIICPGGQTTLIANGNGLQFAWDNASTLNVSNAKTVIASPTTTTTYSVTATLNACNTVATTTIEVQDAPLMTVTESTNGASICLDSFATITTVCDSCDYYIYNFPNSTVQTTNATQIVSPNVVGAVNIIVNGVGGNGCRAIENVTINVDDCFNGTPFAVQELTAADLVLVQRNQQIQVSTPVRINAVDVYNILGSRVASIAGVASNSASIDASSLSSGIYIVMVKSENGEVTKKLYLN
jgi:hypothetical protein